MTKQAEAIPHLKKDKILAKVIDQVGKIQAQRSKDLYTSLMNAIVSQQLSIKAAATIWERFLCLFDDGYPDAQVVLKLKDETLRSVGLSYQKAGYIKNIARFSLENTLECKHLKNKTDEELIEYLVQIKGVGRWTVEMILMFNLNRPDVLPKDDLGIQNGISRLYKLQPSNKRELFQQMETVAEKWKPYRTLACMYIWRYKDGK